MQFFFEVLLAGLRTRHIFISLSRRKKIDHANPINKGDFLRELATKSSGEHGCASEKDLRETGASAKLRTAIAR